MKKNSFLFFHFNLFFSSVDKEQRKKIVSNCYYPILKIAAEYNIPINIEASARTLLEIKKIDKKFIILFKDLINKKKLYFVGSGFNQIIAPLVPYEVNKKNLQIGNNYYKKILGRIPKTALINEMAFSDNILSIYKESGYKSVILDYENTILAEKKDKLSDLKSNYYKTVYKENLNIIFASSFLFQQFQNCIYGDISFTKYLNILKKYRKEKKFITPIYSGDAEVFNFRGSRFSSERPRTYDEWKRVYKLLDIIKKDLRTDFILIDDLKTSKKNIISNLTSPKNPIIVKKQPKYNISRWAVTGRSDQLINTYCYKIYKNKTIIIKKIGTKKFYENLLDLWSSDYRTHITKKRWKYFQLNLEKMLKLIKNKQTKKNYKYTYVENTKTINTDKEKTILYVNTNRIKISLNLKRGLAIDKLAFKSHNFKPILGTVHRDKMKSIHEGADFYSGNMTHEIINTMKKITDLNPVIPKIYENQNQINICSTQKFQNGKLKKIIEIFKNKEKINLLCEYNCVSKNIGSLRMNNITFLNISGKKINFKSKNGGNYLEKFHLNDYFDQSSPPTKFVSLKSGLGCTDSKLIFKIGEKLINFEWDNSENYVMPVMQFKKIKNQKLLRIFFSNQEYDDTSHLRSSSNKFKIKITTKN